MIYFARKQRTIEQTERPAYPKSQRLSRRVANTLNTTSQHFTHFYLRLLSIFPLVTLSLLLLINYSLTLVHSQLLTDCHCVCFSQTHLYSSKQSLPDKQNHLLLQLFSLSFCFPFLNRLLLKLRKTLAWIYLSVPFPDLP